MEENLLVIKLSNLDAIPKVYYKGEEVTRKIKVSFDWETDTDEFGGSKIHIEHAELGKPSTKTTIHKTGKFIFEEYERKENEKKKVLEIEINGLVSLETKEKIKNEILKDISKGIIVHDESVDLNVLEFDEVKVGD